MAGSTPRIIVYHADCLDGAACAWTLAQHLGVSADTPGAFYVPYNHHNTAATESRIRAHLAPGAAVHFVDVAPTVRFLDELLGAGVASHVQILDHHKTAAKRFRHHPAHPRLEIDIDPARHSAIALIWHKLHGDLKMPDLFAMIDKMDGSARGLKTDDDFAAAAMIDSMNIRCIDKAFARLPAMIRLPLDQMVADGRHLVEEQDVRIDALFSTASEAHVVLEEGGAPVPVPVVKADVAHYGRRISSRLSELGQSFGPGLAIAWTERDSGEISVSLRSNGTPDVCKIAEYLSETLGVDGGGHDDAAAIHFDSAGAFFAWANIRRHPVSG